MKNFKLNLRDKLDVLNRDLPKVKMPNTSRHSYNNSINEASQIQYYTEQIKQLKQMVNMQEKEIHKLKEMNKFLLLSNQQKADVIDTERRSLHIPAQQDVVALPQRRSSINMSLSTPVIRRQTVLRNTMLRHDEQEQPPRQQTTQQRERDKQVQQILSYLQAEECFKINTILNMALNDQEAVYLYEADGTIMLIDNLLRDEELFIDIIHQSTAQQISFIYDKLRKFQTEHRQFFTMVLRLKKILQGALQINQSVLLDDAISTIMDQIMECLDCDRASCFMLDPSSNELWSKVVKGTQQIIRMPIGKGIAGCCAKARQIINVQNAYVDNRFNSDMDIKTNYKTRTVLACPIMERDRCLGVLQCVNKNTGHFNNDDEALLTILADFSRTVLTNTMNHDEEVLIKNKLRYTVKTGMVLSKLLGNQQNLLIQAQVRLKSMMGVDIARVIVHNADERQLSFYLEDTSFSKVPDKLGIAGEVIATGKMVNTYNCYTHPSFNPTVDLQTSMPMIKFLGCLKYHNCVKTQVANARGISTYYQSASPKISTIDMEVLEYFAAQMGEAIALSRTGT